MLFNILIHTRNPKSYSEVRNFYSVTAIEATVIQIAVPCIQFNPILKAAFLIFLVGPDAVCRSENVFAGYDCSATQNLNLSELPTDLL